MLPDTEAVDRKTNWPNWKKNLDNYLETKTDVIGACNMRAYTFNQTYE